MSTPFTLHLSLCHGPGGIESHTLQLNIDWDEDERGRFVEWELLSIDPEFPKDSDLDEETFGNLVNDAIHKLLAQSKCTKH